MSIRSKKGPAIALIALVVVAAGFLTAYLLLRPQTIEGSKTITVEVVFADGTVRDHTIHTNAKYLSDALEKQNPSLISGQKSAAGLFITTVDGVTANDGLQQWWCITKGGAQVDTGADQTPIADGDHFEITLTTGYGG